MAATTIPLINSVLEALQARLPDVSFVASDLFSWNPNKQLITYDTGDLYITERLLHESGHALCRHAEYTRDITLLEMERDAWESAKQLGKELALPVEEDVVQDHLDEYRLWLHARSTCPNCSQIGIQATQDSYSCPLCLASWQVNDSRTCQLRRYLK